MKKTVGLLPQLISFLRSFSACFCILCSQLLWISMLIAFQAPLPLLKRFVAGNKNYLGNSNFFCFLFSNMNAFSCAAIHIEQIRECFGNVRHYFI